MHLTVILLSLVLQCCEAYTIAGCDDNNNIFLREDEGRPFTLVCNNIGQYDTVCWDTSSSLIECCDDNYVCKVNTGYDVRLERPYRGTSKLTFTGNIREQENNPFSCYQWGVAYPASATCYLRFVYPGTPDRSSCSVRINTTTWTVNGYCDIPKIYRSTGAYSCTWYQKHSGQRRSVTERMAITDHFHDDSGRLYYRGACSFTMPLPTVEGRYVYSLLVSPASKEQIVRTVQIGAPRLDDTVQGKGSQSNPLVLSKQETVQISLVAFPSPRMQSVVFLGTDFSDVDVSNDTGELSTALQVDCQPSDDIIYTFFCTMNISDEDQAENGLYRMKLGNSFGSVDVFIKLDGIVKGEPEASEAVPLAAIAGGVGGAVALLVVIVIVTLVAISRRKKETSNQNFQGISNISNEEAETEFEEHINVIYGMDEASAANLHSVPSPRPVAVAWKVSSQNKTMEEHDDDGPSYQAISDTRREPPHCADADYTTVAENQADANGSQDVYAAVDKTAKKNRPQTLAVSPSTSQHGDVYAQVNKGPKARHSATGSARQTQENRGPEHVNTDSRKAKPTVKPKRTSKRKSADADGGAKRSSARGVRYNYENVGAFSPEHPSSPIINEVDMTQTPAADDEYNTLMISGRQPSESDKGQNPEYSHIGDI